MGQPVRSVRPRDPGWQPRCQTARELVAPPVSAGLPEPETRARVQTDLDAYRQWKPEAQERALDLLRRAETSPWRPFYCPKAGCDGLPHDNWDWNHARDDQRMPSLSIAWLVWLLSGGRGSGKTRTGSETTHRAAKKVGRITLVAPTGPDLRNTMVEGSSGLLATAPPDFVPEWEPSKRLLTWPNGCTALGFSGEEPDRLRGSNSEWAWVDEPAHMPLIEDVWSNMLLGLRIGKSPRVVATTTPKATKWMKALASDESTIISRVSTYANLDNLSPTFRKTVLDRYEGTRLGKQELHGELLEDVEGALWTDAMIEYADQPEQFDRIVVAIDPAGTTNRQSDETGIIVLGLVGAIIYVLADLTGKYSPSGWATAAVHAYETWSADAIVAEKNYGGDMVTDVLENNGAKNIRIIMVTSRRGKALRAEPIVALYEKHRVKHIKSATPLLETEQTSWVPAGKMPSPNRVDALVHGATELGDVVGPSEMSMPVARPGRANPGFGRSGSVPTLYGRPDPSRVLSGH